MTSSENRVSARYANNRYFPKTRVAEQEDPRWQVPRFARPPQSEPR
jgi:hypothetical protein